MVTTYLDELPFGDEDFINAGFMIYALDMGLLGAWTAIAADQLVRTVLVAIVYHRGRWKAIQY